MQCNGLRNVSFSFLFYIFTSTFCAQKKCHTKFVLTFSYILRRGKYQIICLITSLMYKLDTLLLKQTKLPVLDITGFFFRVHTQVKVLALTFNWVRMRKKKPVISNTADSFVAIVTVSYTLINCHNIYLLFYF